MEFKTLVFKAWKVMEFEELERVRTLARERGSLVQAVLLSTNCCMPKLFLNNIILGRILMLIIGIEIG